MANDRLIMKCRFCGDNATLAKYYPTIGRGVWNRDFVCDFIDKHMNECVPTEMDLKGNRVFNLFTENTTSEEGAAKMEIVRAVSNSIVKKQ